jgi:type III pantothenate kinase
MLLVIDIGNSDVTIGLDAHGEWKHIWRIGTGNFTEVYYALQMQNNFLEARIKTSDITSSVISSVVPALTDTLVNVTHGLTGSRPVVLSVPLYNLLPVKVMNPYEIGSDLVANALAAYTMYQCNCVVVDFGTALTFTVVNNTGEIIGVAIAPGLKTALKSLAQNTAKLFDVPLEFPSSVLGKNTVHAIQAGLLFGYEGVVQNILHRLKQEVSPDIRSVATGGLSAIIPSLTRTVDNIVPTLTLDGLRIVSEYTRDLQRDVHTP